MPRPNILTVTPSTGLTGGRRLVEIAGNNFQLPPAPAASGPTTAPNPSVEVLFGTKRALSVAVVSTERLLVVTPINDPGVVSVTVRNIDQTGAVVAGETTTKPAAFTYARPDLNAKSDLTRVVEAMIVELMRQVIENVELTVHTDYAEQGAEVAMLSEVPGLVLAGPDLRDNRFYSLNQKRSVDLGGGLFRQLRPPKTVDLIFTIIGVSESKAQTINLMKEVVTFFERNDFLSVPRDAAQPDGETVEYELDFEPDGVPKMDRGSNNSNIRSFTGSFVIRGVDIDDTDMAFEETKALEDQQAPGDTGIGLPSPVVLDNAQAPSPPAALGGGVIQFGPGFPPGPSPGDET